jgi:hypothetical protein
MLYRLCSSQSFTVYNTFQLLFDGNNETILLFYIVRDYSISTTGRGNFFSLVVKMVL